MVIVLVPHEDSFLSVEKMIWLVIFVLCLTEINVAEGSACDLFPTMDSCNESTSNNSPTSVGSSPSPVDPTNVKVTVGFLFDGTNQMNAFKSSLVSAAQTFVSFMSQVESTRVDGYFLMLYRDTDDTVMKATPDSSTMSGYLASYGASPGFIMPKCMPSNPKLLFVQALSRSTPRCLLFWVVGANTVMVDSQTFESLMIGLTERQCRVDIVLYDIGCFDRTLSSYTIFQNIADVTGGVVYSLNATSALTIDDVAMAWSVQHTTQRVTLVKGRRPAGNYIERVVVDSTLTDVTVLLQGCGLKADIRDNRGIWLSTDTTGITYSVVSSDQLIYTLVQTSPTNTYASAGPGQWVFNATSSCSLNFEINGMANEAFRFSFAAFISTNSSSEVAMPLIGVKERVKLYPVIVPSPYPNYVEYVDLQGNPFDGATLSVYGSSFATDQYLTANGQTFYIRVTGIDSNNFLFQRFSYTPYYARGLNSAVNLPTTGTCMGKFDCNGYATTCVDYGALGDCDPVCPNGADEACIRGYSKCDCHCIPDGSICRDSSPGSSCTTNYGISFFQCISDGSCILSSFVNDGVRDCDDFSDENPAYFNECNSPSGSQTANWCSPQATCTKIPKSSYYCSCPAGQWGDGFTCQVIPPPTAGPTTIAAASVTGALPTTMLPSNNTSVNGTATNATTKILVPMNVTAPVTTVVISLTTANLVILPATTPPPLPPATVAPTILPSPQLSTAIPLTTAPLTYPSSAPSSAPSSSQPTTGVLSTASSPTTAVPPTGSPSPPSTVPPLPPTATTGAPSTAPPPSPTTAVLSTGSPPPLSTLPPLPPLATTTTGAPSTVPPPPPTTAAQSTTPPPTPTVTPAAPSAVPQSPPATVTLPVVTLPITTAAVATMPAATNAPTSLPPMTQAPPLPTTIMNMVNFGLSSNAWVKMALSAITSLITAIPTSILLTTKSTSVMPVDPLLAAFTSARCPGQFDCGGNYTCVPFSAFHDCKNDCPNLLDESCFHGYTQCDSKKIFNEQGWLRTEYKRDSAMID